jgi:hypothetical protein
VCGTVAAAGGAAVDFVGAAVGDVAEFLDVDVDQVAGCGMFVAADRPGGGAIEVGQPGQGRSG